MTHKQIEIVKSTWAMVSTIDPVAVGALFYNRLFEIAPQVKHLFRNPMPEQSRKLLSMIQYVISKLDRLEDILDEVAQLAQRHGKYGVKPAHFTVVGEALLWTLEQGLGEHWNEETKDAWTKCYLTLSSAMIQSIDSEEHQAA